MKMGKAPTFDSNGSNVMAWKKPRLVEICLGMEINSYVSATV
jgi:coenzyme PQQ precursor peptide PqqA